MYSEKRRPGFFWAIFIITILFLGFYGFMIGQALSSEGIRPDTIIMIIINIIIGPLLVFITWSTSSYMVEIDYNSLTMGYNGWKVKLMHSDIIEAKKVKIIWIKWGGIGWRTRGAKRIGYITGSGPGVRIKTRIKDREYTFTCRDPETLLEKLSRVGVKVNK